MYDVERLKAAGTLRFSKAQTTGAPAESGELPLLKVRGWRKQTQWLDDAKTLSHCLWLFFCTSEETEPSGGDNSQCFCFSPHWLWQEKSQKHAVLWTQQ